MKINLALLAYVAFLFAIVLTGCGGGGGDPAPAERVSVRCTTVGHVTTCDDNSGPAAETPPPPGV